jgi:hypothetical protein
VNIRKVSVRCDLPVGHQMAHQRLEERLVRDPGGAEEAHHVRALADEIEHPSIVRRRRHHHWLPIIT